MMFRRTAMPLPCPERWADDEVFRALWSEIAGLARFDARHLPLLEVAAMLQYELRATGPEFPPEKYRALIDSLALLGLHD